MAKSVVIDLSEAMEWSATCRNADETIRCSFTGFTSDGEAKEHAEAVNRIFGQNGVTWEFYQSTRIKQHGRAGRPGKDE